jgi:hypothetical protein
MTLTLIMTLLSPVMMFDVDDGVRVGNCQLDDDEDGVLDDDDDDDDDDDGAAARMQLSSFSSRSFRFFIAAMRSDNDTDVLNDGSSTMLRASAIKLTQ